MNPLGLLPLTTSLLLVFLGIYITKKASQSIYYRLLGTSCFVLSLVEFLHFWVLISPDAVDALTARLQNGDILIVMTAGDADILCSQVLDKISGR